MPSSKRKALDIANLPRKARKLSDAESSSSGTSSGRSSPKLASPSNTNFQDAEIDDSDDDIATPVTVHDLPERIRMSSKKILAQIPEKGASIPSATTDFVDLGISPTLIRALKTMSIRKPTPVQAACIPSLLAGMRRVSLVF